MPSLPMILLALLIICIASSTAAGRAEARQRMRGLTLPLLIITGLIWAAILLPELLKPG